MKKDQQYSVEVKMITMIFCLWVVNKKKYIVDLVASVICVIRNKRILE